MDNDLNEFKQVILKDVKLQEQGARRNMWHLGISVVQTLLIVLVIFYTFRNQGRAVEDLKNVLHQSITRSDSISFHLLEIKESLFKRDSLQYNNDTSYQRIE